MPTLRLADDEANISDLTLAPRTDPRASCPRPSEYGAEDPAGAVRVGEHRPHEFLAAVAYQALGLIGDSFLDPIRSDHQAADGDDEQQQRRQAEYSVEGKGGR